MPTRGAGRSGQRDKAMLARQAGQRLAAERRSQGITQAQLAEAMGVTPGRVSQIERGGPATIDATARYITALGGELNLVASLGGSPVIIATTAWPGHASDPGTASAGRQACDRLQPARAQARSAHRRPDIMPMYYLAVMEAWRGLCPGRDVPRSGASRVTRSTQDQLSAILSGQAIGTLERYETYLKQGSAGERR